MLKHLHATTHFTEKALFTDAYACPVLAPHAQAHLTKLDTGASRYEPVSDLHPGASRC